MRNEKPTKEFSIRGCAMHHDPRTEPRFPSVAYEVICMGCFPCGEKKQKHAYTRRQTEISVTHLQRNCSSHGTRVPLELPLVRYIPPKSGPKRMFRYSGPNSAHPVVKTGRNMFRVSGPKSAYPKVKHEFSTYTTQHPKQICRRPQIRSDRSPALSMPLPKTRGRDAASEKQMFGSSHGVSPKRDPKMGCSV